MAQAFWKSGWQEGSFERIRGFVGSSPAWFRELSPSDVTEDAYLLTVASTLFLRDEGAAPSPAPGRAPAPAVPPPATPLGVPPFPYERCVSPGGESSSAFGAATSGRYGAFHREVARSAGSPEAWAAALGALRGAGALRPEWPAGRRTHLPPLATFDEDLRACGAAVMKKAIHAFKIGFGLWGRWESS